MPICICCNSWYDKGQEECGRCQTPTAAWETEQARPFREDFQDYFMNPCGILALMAAVIPVVMLLSLASSRVRDSFSSSIGLLIILQLVALIASTIVIVLIYVRRFWLRQHELLRQVRSARSPSLTMLATVILAILLICAGLVVAPYLPSRTAETSFPFFTHFYYFYCVDIVAIASVTFFMLLATGGFIGRLSQRIPPPIYLRVDELASLVLSSAEERLSYGQTPEERLKLIAMRRTKSGGIKIMAKGKERVKKKGDGKLVAVRLDKIWSIEADHWGRIRSIEERKENEA